MDWTSGLAYTSPHRKHHCNCSCQCTHPTSAGPAVIDHPCILMLPLLSSVVIAPCFHRLPHILIHFPQL